MENVSKNKKEGTEDKAGALETKGIYITGVLFMQNGDLT